MRHGGAWQGTARPGEARRGEANFKATLKWRTAMDVAVNRSTDILTRNVVLLGMTDIMFDRYPGDNTTKLEPHQKLYLASDGSRNIGIPSLNIMSFFSAHNTNSAPKRLRDKRKYKDIANALLSFVSIREAFIPLTRNGKPIALG